ncbi:MAG: DnaJ domain-containing protein [Maribacter litoralis]|uniref:J domain-containing protein n=1 Tax=Maribacter litoralis TaxID=2059726 RepID=UPI003298A13F|tara:strand:+ start:304 stop:816 length:513 start_codon:yes stop_codon:yes gene_type:complete
MDFKDYYRILEIPQTASLEEIKIAFKKQAVKWHPDRNLETDTTEKMQEINEAYLILKDKEARERYDREYLRYKEFTSQNQRSSNQEKESESTERTQKTETPNYEFDDEILKNWMRNARRQAVDLAKQTIREVGELSVTATKAAGSKMLQLFVGYAIGGFIILIIFKACSG